MIALRDLASDIGMDHSHLRRYVLKLGIEPERIRTPESRNQLSLAVTDAEADLIRRRRKEGGFTGTPVAPAAVGHFYAIQLEPELEPNRVKFGFASNVKERLTAHRTAAPHAAGAAAVSVHLYACTE